MLIHLAKTFSLVRGQREDACDVVVFGRLLLFGKVTNNVEATVVPLAPDTKITNETALKDANSDRSPHMM